MGSVADWTVDGGFKRGVAPRWAVPQWQRGTRPHPWATVRDHRTAKTSAAKGALRTARLGRANGLKMTPPAFGVANKSKILEKPGNGILEGPKAKMLEQPQTAIPEKPRNGILEKPKLLETQKNALLRGKGIH